MTYLEQVKSDKYSDMAFPNCDFQTVSDLDNYIIFGSCPMRYFDGVSAYKSNVDGSCKVEKYSEVRQQVDCAACWQRSLVPVDLSSVDEYELYLKLKAKYEK